MLSRREIEKLAKEDVEKAYGLENVKVDTEPTFEFPRPPFMLLGASIGGTIGSMPYLLKRDLDPRRDTRRTLTGAGIGMLAGLGLDVYKLKTDPEYRKRLESLASRYMGD